MKQDVRPEMKRDACIHFPMTLALSIFFAALCIGSLAFWFGSYNETDRQAYEKLVSGDDRLPNGFEGSVSKQIRTNLQKNFFFGGEEPRRQLMVQSSSSELALEKNGASIAVIERMQGIEGWMQERLKAAAPEGSDSTETQDIVHFTAKEGAYHYIDETLIADNVRVARFSAKGHDLELVPHADKEEYELKGAMDLAADHARYSGRTLKLNGNVNGKSNGIEISADNAAIIEVGAAGERVVLSGDVEVGFEEHGILTCYEGDIDLNALIGVFRKGSGGAQATYSECFSAAEGEKKSFVVTADEFEGRLIKGDRENSVLERPAIGTLTGQGSVFIEYGSGLSAKGDRVVFVNDLENREKRLAGTVVLTSHRDGERCSVADESGLVVDAGRIDVDIGKRRAVFSHPKGRLSGHGDASGAIDFSADAMLWDDNAMTLTLTGDIELIQEGVGKLNTDREASIILNKVDGKKSVRTIESQGTTVLSYTDPGNELEHTLKCYGKIKIDHVRKESQLHSPKDGEGVIAEGKQVYFQDEKGSAHADRVFIKYEESDKKLTPVRIVLEGNVRIVNELPKGKEGDTFSQQYILADRVDFLPQTKEMIFKADKGRRVLLLDKNNNMEVSAPALKLVRDRGADKESVQSIGGVRLHFVESELEQLRQHFKFVKQ